jgi:putative nucleotidyltransferase with HDIG domain
VRNLAMAVAAQSWFGSGSGGSTMTHEDLWQHSLGVAGAASAICSRVQPDKESEAFCTGLLHDIGKIAFHAKFKSGYSDLQKHALHSGLTLVEAEDKAYGFDHAQLGFHLAESWNLPLHLSEAIRDHHHPDEATPPSPLTDMIHVANFLVWQTCAEMAPINGPVSVSAIQRLGFESEEDFGWVTDSIEERQKRLTGLLQAA